MVHICLLKSTCQRRILGQELGIDNFNLADANKKRSGGCAGHSHSLFFLLKPLYILSSHITKRTFKEVRITKRSLDQNHMETTEIEPVKNMPAVS
jgi:hypothetical protein